MNLINSCKGTGRQDKFNMGPKFFSQISDQQHRARGPGPFQEPSSYSQLCRWSLICQCMVCLVIRCLLSLL
jgi:hypothetical protein